MDSFVGTFGGFGVLFLVSTAILWFFLPFAVFGVKDRLDNSNAELKKIRIELQKLNINININSDSVSTENKIVAHAEKPKKQHTEQPKKEHTKSVHHPLVAKWNQFQRWLRWWIYQ